MFRGCKIKFFIYSIGGYSSQRKIFQLRPNSADIQLMIEEVKAKRSEERPQCQNLTELQWGQIVFPGACMYLTEPSYQVFV